MTKQHFKRLLQYAVDEENYAILFVRKYLKQDTSDKWINIISFECPRFFDMQRLQFKTVTFELFPKKEYPKYPHRKKFNTEKEWIETCRAITSEVACRDISNQKAKGYKGKTYCIRAAKYKKYSYFRDDAPEEIKALEKNLADRTSPLWDEAEKYRRPSQYCFRIMGVQRVEV